MGLKALSSNSSCSRGLVYHWVPLGVLLVYHWGASSP